MEHLVLTPTNQSLFLAAIFVVAAKLVYHLLRRAARPPYPPGPKPKILIGNALDFPKNNARRVYVEWGRKFNSAFGPR
jgi:hypothetical protein